MVYTDKFGHICEYLGVPDDAHRGKCEWHHPLSWTIDVGIELCESHHSLARLNGWRKKRYINEMQVNKTLDEIREEVINLIHDRVFKAGYNPSDIDKS